MAKRIEEGVDPSLLANFQIIHSRVREIDPSKQQILVLHDLPGDPEAEHLKDGGWKRFSKLVFVSHWQQQQFNTYLGVPFHAGIVLKNAIEPIDIIAKSHDKIKLIYTSTPHRGLNILYPVFAQLSKEFPQLELDVYSSFNLYGWPERDEPFRQLFDMLRSHPKINYHGSQPNNVIRKALQQADIFAYPSIWQETSCLCLIEAMSAGLTAVHSSLAALPETSIGLTTIYNYHEDYQAHAGIFYAHLRNTIEQYQTSRDLMENRAKFVKQAADFVYDWNIRKTQWNNLLKALHQNER